MSDEINIIGADELIKEIEEAVKKYPDVAQDAVKEAGKRFKKKLKENVRSAVRSSSDNCRKLTSGFSTSVKMSGLYTRCEFSAENPSKNPHWHLVENGHEMYGPENRHIKELSQGFKTLGVRPHEHKGFVSGIKQVDRTVDQFEGEFKAAVETSIDKYVKEFGE